MNPEPHSRFLRGLRDRINLREIPFSERGSRLLVFLNDNQFTVQLAERWFRPDADETQIHRPRNTVIQHFQFIDESGTPLEIHATTYPHAIGCETRLGTFVLTFVDPETLLVALPSAVCGVTFQANFDKVQTDRRGAVLRAAETMQRNLAITTNAPLVVNEIVTASPGKQAIRLKLDASQGEQAMLLNITPRLGFNRWVPAPQAALIAAASRWHDWFAAAPQVVDPYQSQYYYAWWIMRAGLISSRFYTTREAMTPSKTHYVGVWQWDNFFHALAYRHIEPRLAQDQIRVLLDHQREDGMIPDAIHDAGIVTRLGHPIEADVTKPPLIGWAAWKLFEYDSDREFLNEIYEPLVRWNNWWFEKNDIDANGLCEYQHPYSSGLDNSPLWDDGMPVEAPDLNTYLFLQQEALSRIAGVIGERDDSVRWAERAATMIERLIQYCWDSDAGLFWAKRNGIKINVRTPFNLFPLMCGCLPSDITQKLVAHLTNEKEFWPRYPVPTVALDDPAFHPAKMWRGPTWVNVNYLLIEGLHRSGYSAFARELRHRTLELLAGQDDIYEYYDPQTGKNPPDAASTFGWSAALYIDLAIQATREVEEQK